jgi:hypothetical protein
MHTMGGIRIGLFSILGLATFLLLPVTPLLLLIGFLELRAGWSVGILYEIAIFVVTPWLVLLGLWDLAQRATRKQVLAPPHRPDKAGAGRLVRGLALPLAPALSTFVALVALLGCVIYDTSVDLAMALLRLWFGLCLLAAVYYALRVRLSAALGYLLPLAMVSPVALARHDIGRAVDPVRTRVLHDKFANCIDDAPTLDNGNFAICEASDDDYLVTATLIVYDSTDQIARPAARRSIAWTKFVESLPHTPFGVLDFTVHPLGGHLYKVSFFDHDGLTGL